MSNTHVGVFNARVDVSNTHVGVFKICVGVYIARMGLAIPRVKTGGQNAAGKPYHWALELCPMQGPGGAFFFHERGTPLSLGP